MLTDYLWPNSRPTSMNCISGHLFAYHLLTSVVQAPAEEPFSVQVERRTLWNGGVFRVARNDLCGRRSVSRDLQGDAIVIGNRVSMETNGGDCDV